jgi:hypothetical protein
MLWCAVGVLGAPAFAASVAASSQAAAIGGRLAASYGQLPLSFESSTESSAQPGQAAKDVHSRDVRFVAHGQGYGLYLTTQGAVLTLHPPEAVRSRRVGRKARVGRSPLILGAPVPASPGGSAFVATTDATPTPGISAVSADGYAAGIAAPAARAGAVLRIKLAGARDGVQPDGVEPLPGKANYILGNDPSRWRTGVSTYARVRYAGVYPGVDLVYYGSQRQLEHDFVVAPGADPAPIRLRFEGASALKLDGTGNLRIATGSGELALQKPVVYQMADGKRRPIRGGFRLLGDNTVGFALGVWDRGRPLVIDPVLSYSTYLGGSDQEYAVSIAVNSAGEAYLTGLTWSVDFPVTAGADEAVNYATSVNSVSTAFICKLNASGTALVYSTYLGGDATPNTQFAQGDFSHSIAVDPSGNAYVTGWTYSSNFPVTAGAYQSTNFAATSAEATGFVSKLNPSGTALVYSTYLGGSKLDEPTGLAVDSSGSVYTTGYTFSNDYPVKAGAFQSANKSPQAWNMFVSKLNPTGTALVYSTYLGGSGESNATIHGIYAPISVALDNSGDAYVAGFAVSGDFPVTAGAYQSNNFAFAKAGTNLTLSKLNPTGTGLLYSTYLGGSSYPGDFATALAVDGAGNAYVTGYTYSSDFPTTSGAFQTGKAAAYETVFASKMNSTGSGLVYSTFVGGNAAEDGYGLAVDGSGDAYLTGTTASSNFPVSANAWQSANAATAGDTAFLTELNPSGSGLLYSTFLGGSVNDGGYAVALGGSGAVYLAGYTSSSDFPVTLDALQTAYHSTHNTAFAAQFNLGPAPSAAATQTILQASANPQLPGNAVTFTATVQPLSGVGTPGGNTVFSIDEAAVATVALDSSGNASYQAGSLGSGQHYILASYQGNSAYASSGDGLTEEILFPPPAITSLAPFTAVAGGPAFTLTINGSNFYPGATLNWGGMALAATWVNANRLTVPIPASLIAAAGTVEVTTTSSGGTTAPAPFTITPNGVFPLLLSLSPASATAAGGQFTLTISGANFTANSRVLWNGSPRTTVFVGSSQLTATIVASDIAVAGSGLVSVASPAPNAATAAALPFAVAGAAQVAQIAQACMAETPDNTGNHALSLMGNGLLPSSTVQWQSGVSAPITLDAIYVSPWQLSAVLTAAQFSSLSSETAIVTVVNPAGASGGFLVP